MREVCDPDVHTSGAHFDFAFLTFKSDIFPCMALAALALELNQSI